MKIKIFYHLFTENYWKEIFQSHLQSIVESKLYDSIEVMKVYVIWKEKGDLQKAVDMCRAYKKIKVYNRNFHKDPPFGISRTVHKVGLKFTKKEGGGERFEIQLSEAETILKIVAY